MGVGITAVQLNLQQCQLSFMVHVVYAKSHWKICSFIEVIFENIQQINDIKAWTIYIADEEFKVGMWNFHNVLWKTHSLNPVRVIEFTMPVVWNLPTNRNVTRFVSLFFSNILALEFRKTKTLSVWCQSLHFREQVYPWHRKH